MIPTPLNNTFVGEMEVQRIARSPEVRKAAGELSDMVCAESSSEFSAGTRSSAKTR